MTPSWPLLPVKMDAKMNDSIISVSYQRDTFQSNIKPTTTTLVPFAIPIKDPTRMAKGTRYAFRLFTCVALLILKPEQALKRLTNGEKKEREFDVGKFTWLGFPFFSFLNT